MATILERLEKLYPDAQCSLGYADPLQLVVATILSAQCTDERVNRVTPALFATYRTAAAYAAADPQQLRREIRPTGFFRNKAAAIIGAPAAIAGRHGGEVPRTMEELTALPGVGRKTANVILGNAFGIPGVVVDTHVGRIARRLGWTGAADPAPVEQDLMRLVPRGRWVRLSHQLIAHGRALCRAPRPLCEVFPRREALPLAPGETRGLTTLRPPAHRRPPRRRILYQACQGFSYERCIKE